MSNASFPHFHSPYERDAHERFAWAMEMTGYGQLGRAAGRVPSIPAHEPLENSLGKNREPWKGDISNESKHVTFLKSLDMMSRDRTSPKIFLV
jgi:hypothetical protein